MKPWLDLNNPRAVHVYSSGQETWQASWRERHILYYRGYIPDWTPEEWKLAADFIEGHRRGLAQIERGEYVLEYGQLVAVETEQK